MDRFDYNPDEEEAAVQAAALRLKRQADWWAVDIPADWYVTGFDGSSFIGALYHDELQARIRTKRLNVLMQMIGFVGGLLGIASFVMSRC